MFLRVVENPWHDFDLVAAARVGSLPIRKQSRRKSDHRPPSQLPNVWFAGGGSGHGFKLSPAVGELAAARILTDKEVPAQFRLDRLPKVKKGTQFETKE